MGVFDRLFGKGRSAEKAHKAELSGDLTRAIELWVEAGRHDEAARVMILRGDSEIDPKMRLIAYAQAVELAPAESDSKKVAKKKRAELTITLAGDTAVSALAKKDLREAAAELEDIGENERAAEAYALAGDRDGQARALTAAGDVDELEHLLEEQAFSERLARKKSDAQADAEALAQSGRRREALNALEELLRATPDDVRVRERAQSIRSRKLIGPVLKLVVGGQKMSYVLGPEITIGRTEGTLTSASSAISRHHLRIFRRDGAVLVQDLESRNGTQLRGVNLAGALPIHEGIDLKLGKEVPLRVAPSATLSGAIDVDLAGERYVAPLGSGHFSIEGWSLETGGDGWVELTSTEARPAFVTKTLLVPRATLLIGDAIAADRDAEPVVRVLAV